MSDFDISRLKAKQDEIHLRKTRLLEQFIPYREGLIEALERFTEEAVEAGLESAKLLKRVTTAGGVLQVTMTLNNFDLAIVSTDETHYMNLPAPADLFKPVELFLSSRIFFYLDTSEDNTPFVEIFAREMPSQAYSYRVQWLTTKGPDIVAAGNSISREDGFKTAIALINHFYSFETYWNEKPTRKAMLAKKGNLSRPFGFTPPKE